MGITAEEIIIGDHIRVVYTSDIGNFTSVREGIVASFTRKSHNPVTEDGYLLITTETPTQRSWSNEGVDLGTTEITLLGRNPLRFLSTDKMYVLPHHDEPDEVYVFVRNNDNWDVVSMKTEDYLRRVPEMVVAGTYKRIREKALQWCTYPKETEIFYFDILLAGFEKRIIESIQNYPDGIQEVEYNPLNKLDREKIYKCIESNKVIYFEEKKWKSLVLGVDRSPVAYRYNDTEYQLLFELDVDEYVYSEFADGVFVSTDNTIYKVIGTYRQKTVKNPSTGKRDTTVLDAEGLRKLTIEHITGNIQEIF